MALGIASVLAATVALQRLAEWPAAGAAARAPQRPGMLFTIHNLSYQGLFSWETFQSLALPPELWSMHSMEYFGNFHRGRIVTAT